VPKQWPEIFLIIALLTVCIPAATATELPVHITTAHILNIPRQDFSAPPQVVNEQLLPDKWSTVNLPHALTRQLIPSSAPHEHKRTATIETWYRLQLPAPASETQKQTLYSTLENRWQPCHLCRRSADLHVKRWRVLEWLEYPPEHPVKCNSQHTQPQHYPFAHPTPERFGWRYFLYMGARKQQPKLALPASILTTGPAAVYQ